MGGGVGADNSGGSCDSWAVHVVCGHIIEPATWDYPEKMDDQETEVCRR